MATRSYRFEFHNVELFKEDTLGTGSYGGVCRANCDGLPCAAKIMHPMLLDLRDPGTASYLSRFEEECCLLSSARHPNVVQYLGTYRDPETRLPVLLMELCDESLCRFLERSPGPVAYHTQLNIAHDIALALVYLHQNSLTHRDLTSNNVLMIASTRAKVTDFGMSKLASVNPRTTQMTQCPGNIQYMSPEALEEPPSYTHKLDVFSFGVILVQIMTRRFPDPGPRFQALSLPNYREGSIKMAVAETHRRASHLKLIEDTHPLKTVAVHCLKDKEGGRPTAQQLNTTLCELKQAPYYMESLQQVQDRVGGEGELERLQNEVRDLKQQLQTQQQEIAGKEQELVQMRAAVDEKERENKQLRVERDGFQTQLQQIQHEQRLLTEARTEEALELKSALREKERELGERDCAMQSSENLKADALDEKERESDEFQQTISDKSKSLQLQQESATETLARKGNKDMKWENGEKAPEIMWRGSTVVHGNIVFINPQGSKKIYSCQITAKSQGWSTLPDIPYSSSSLAIIDDVLTSVGGAYTNCLFSLPTSRSDTVLLGGLEDEQLLDFRIRCEVEEQSW